MTFKTNGFRLIAGVLVAMGACAGAARADMSIAAVGRPIAGGSWFQSFEISTSDSFNKFGIGLTAPDATSYFGLLNTPSPAINFSLGGTSGWAQDFFGPFPSGPGFVATAGGTSTTELVWRSHFADPQAQAFTMTVFAY